MESELKLLRRVSKILFMVCFALIVFCIVRWIVGWAEPTIIGIFKIAFCTIALILNYEPDEE